MDSRLRGGDRPVLHGTKPSTPSSTGRADLDAAAAEFEAIFARMMLASMRQAKLGEDILGGDGGTMFRGRFDAEIAATLGTRGALGIGRALADFLQRGAPKDELT